MTEDGILDPALRAVRRADRMRPYDRHGTANPRLEWRPLSGERGSAFESFFLRFKPGGRSTPHEHVGGEEFYVIEGELVDCDGEVFRAGDHVAFEPGSRHYSHSPNGCLLLVILRGANRRID